MNRLFPLRVPGACVLVATILAASIGVNAAAAQAIERNVPYRAGATRDQRLDITAPEHAPADGAPVVLFIHGGSLDEGGERRDSPMYAGVCPGLVARGLVCATMDYRLAPGAQWPAMPEDVADAVRWLRDSVRSRGGNPSRIVLVGHSSGCLLATIVGSDPRYLARVGLGPSDIAGVVAMGCTLAPWDTSGRHLSPGQLAAAFAADADERRIYPSLEWRLRANPMRWIGGQTPSTLVLVAESERFAPPVLEEGARYVREMREHGRSADLRILAGRRHVTTTTGFADPDDPVATLVAAFARDPSSVVATP